MREDVSCREECWRQIARKQEAVEVLVMADADMAKSIEHALIREDTVRVHEVVDQFRIRSGRRRVGYLRGNAPETGHASSSQYEVRSPHGEGHLKKFTPFHFCPIWSREASRKILAQSR